MNIKRDERSSYITHYLLPLIKHFIFRHNCIRVYYTVSPANAFQCGGDILFICDDRFFRKWAASPQIKREISATLSERTNIDVSILQ